MIFLLDLPPERIGPEYLGVVIPLITFLVAFLAVYYLYRRFSRK